MHREFNYIVSYVDHSFLISLLQAMYQREAMWISFTAMEPCAVKVSIGGINAITGTPRNVSVPGTQDYLALGDEEFGQL